MFPGVIGAPQPAKTPYGVALQRLDADESALESELYDLHEAAEELEGVCEMCGIAIAQHTTSGMTMKTP